MRPVTIDDGLARRVRLSPASLVASLARAFQSSIVSEGLFRSGRIDRDLSNNFPISLNRPGFSSRAGTGGGAGSLCWAGAWTPREEGGAACGQARPAAATNTHDAAAAVAA